MLLGWMRNMVIFPNSAKQIMAIIARIIKLLRWYNWGVLQLFDIFNLFIISCEVLLAPSYKCHWFAFIIRACGYAYVYVCVYSVKNALTFVKKKSANKIYHEKIRQKFWVL